MALSWRIWYDDLSSYSSLDGSPQDAPAFGVICIVQPDDETGRTILHRWDFYYFVPDEAEGGQWWGGDREGVFDRLFHNLPVVALKLGRMVSDQKYRKILADAAADPDFPIKSAKSVSEKPHAFEGYKEAQP